MNHDMAHQRQSMIPEIATLPTGLKLSQDEHHLIRQLRDRKPARNKPAYQFHWGDRLSDKVAATVGSWPFVIIQSTLLAIWILVNITAYMKHWDPYPFILLNLMLSFQAAYTAPIIMMSQNRQANIDRQEARHDYEINLKAELEIELLQTQINALRSQDITQIMQCLERHQVSLDRLLVMLENQHK